MERCRCTARAQWLALARAEPRALAERHATVVFDRCRDLLFDVTVAWIVLGATSVQGQETKTDSRAQDKATHSVSLIGLQGMVRTRLYPMIPYAPTEANGCSCDGIAGGQAVLPMR